MVLALTNHVQVDGRPSRAGQMIKDACLGLFLYYELVFVALV